VEAARDLPNLSVSAYIDDIAVVGPLDQASTFFGRLRELSPSLGLALSLSKSSLLWPAALLPPASISAWAASHSIPLARGTVPLLGSAVGLDATGRERFASERVTALEPFFRALRHPLLGSSLSPSSSCLCCPAPAVHL